MPDRRRPLAAVLSAALLAIATIAGGTVAIAGGDTSPPSGHTVQHRPQLLRADRATRPARLTPLRRLDPPDLVVIARHRVSDRRTARLAAVPGVRAVTALDRGTVRIRGHRLRVVAAKPDRVRRFTPALTAQSQALWESVARGELTVSSSSARPLRRHFGSTVVVRGVRRPVRIRIGAFASLGVGHVDGLVDRAVGRLLGLQQRRIVLVSAPRLSLDTLHADVHAVLGSDVRIRVLRPSIVDQTQMSDYARATIPPSYLALYRRAASTCVGLPWTVLAAIGAVETGHGVDTRTSSKGAMGPMQFLPDTFVAYAVDGDGDGIADIHNPADAVFSAARYLCLWGAGRGGQALYDAIWAYNHADWYVRQVLALAVAYT